MEWVLYIYCNEPMYNMGFFEFLKCYNTAVTRCRYPNDRTEVQTTGNEGTRRSGCSSTIIQNKFSESTVTYKRREEKLVYGVRYVSDLAHHRHRHNDINSDKSRA